MGFIVFEEEAFNYLDAQLENFVKRMDRIRERSEDYPDYQFFCTCRASRKKLGSLLPDHQLQTVAAYCGYDLTMHHNALADAEACAWIAMKLL